jgi:outer membrane receptor protein involved in Fe transport
VQGRDYYNSFASVNAARTSVTQASEQYDVPSTGLGARFELRPDIGPVEVRLGGDWRKTEGETRELFNFQNGIGTRRRIAGGETDTFGGFAETAWVRRALTLSGGARIDRWLIRDGSLDESVIATGAVLNALDYADRSGWEPTARAGAAWRPADGLTLRSAAYLGWRLPTLNELHRPFRVGADATAANPELEPERLQGIEAGLDYRPRPALRVGVTVFTNRLKEGIANVTLGRGPGVFPGVGFVAAGGEYRQRRNIDAIAATGLELDARLDLGSWSVSGGYSFADAEVRAGGAALPLNGLRPAQTPEHSLAGTLSWRGADGARASLTARYVGTQYEDDLNQQLLPDAFTVDAAASMPLTKALAIEARAENIGNARMVAGISGHGLIERATPRTLWIGVRLRD